MLKLTKMPWMLVGLRFAIALCLINSLEEIVMTLILPQWTHDVLSLNHALKWRDGLRSGLK